MIHDLDILLAFADSPVTEVRSLGIPVVTDKVDIAHARLEFASGAVASVTASRVSVEKVRKLRFFQTHEYISLDYGRQDALRIRVKQPGPNPQFDFQQITDGTPGTSRRRVESVSASRTKAHGAGGGRARRTPSPGTGGPGDGGHPRAWPERQTASLRASAGKRMIGRQLIPRDARLTAETAGRRPFSLLDERQLIPGNMRGGPLETRTTIPAHLPLDSLAARVVVPRDMPATPLDWASVHPDYPPLTILDYRVTVPAATADGHIRGQGRRALPGTPGRAAAGRHHHR